MTVSDLCIILATLLGPVLAVQAQKWLERHRNAYDRKMNVFATLMTTRATRTSPEHVRALNSIDIVFHRNSQVVAKWREYSDALNLIDATTDGKFLDLMFEMSRELKFDFDRVMLKRVVYLPQSHVDAEKMQQEIQSDLGTMLKGQQEIQKEMLQYLKGEKPLRVDIENRDKPL